MTRSWTTSRTTQLYIPSARIRNFSTFSTAIQGDLLFLVPRVDFLGVPVPDDPEHTMYVWFEALISYSLPSDIPPHYGRRSHLDMATDLQVWEKRHTP